MEDPAKTGALQDPPEVQMSFGYPAGIPWA